MKYLVLLCDGMSDYSVAELMNKTPMEKAYKPNMDKLAKSAEIGLCKTVPDGFKPGSDVANLSVMGYDPRRCYTGRSPLEAASIGIDLKDTDVTLRCNLVTLSDEADYEAKTMVDYCADDISTEEAREIIAAVQKEFGNDLYAFYSGVAYRHCLVVSNGTTDLGNMTPPHDISGRVIGPYLSDSPQAADLIRMMKESHHLLKDHPVNVKRISQGRRPANSIWLWGEGSKPGLDNFKALNGVSGGVVSAVDLVKGIGILAGMEIAQVKGATGYIDTDFDAKAKATAALFEQCDLVYLHLEAPDECGHRGERDNKVKAIELIDEKVLPVVREAMEKMGPYRILIMPDHPTPLSIKTHTAEPVPYLLYDSTAILGQHVIFSEKEASASGILVENGFEIMAKLLDK